MASVTIQFTDISLKSLRKQAMRSGSAKASAGSATAIRWRVPIFTLKFAKTAVRWIRCRGSGSNSYFIFLALNSSFRLFSISLEEIYDAHGSQAWSALSTFGGRYRAGIFSLGPLGSERFRGRSPGLCEPRGIQQYPFDR